MSYEILKTAINNVQAPATEAESLYEITEKFLNNQNERVTFLQNELTKKDEEIKSLRSENQKLLETSNSQSAPIENQKPLSAQEVYRKFQLGKGDEILSQLERK